MTARDNAEAGALLLGGAAVLVVLACVVRSVDDRAATLVCAGRLVVAGAELLLMAGAQWVGLEVSRG